MGYAPCAWTHTSKTPTPSFLCEGTPTPPSRARPTPLPTTLWHFLSLSHLSIFSYSLFPEGEKLVYGCYAMRMSHTACIGLPTVLSSGMSMVHNIPALEPSQLAELLALEASPRPVDRIRQKHHLLARYLAKGHAIVDAAMLSGYSSGAARVLENDPAFQDLLRYYTKELEEYKEQLIVKLEAISIEAADELMDRLSDETLRAKMSVTQLERLVVLASDRLGLAPQRAAAEVNINVNIASRLDAANRRLRLIETPVIEMAATPFEEVV